MGYNPCLLTSYLIQLSKNIVPSLRWFISLDYNISVHLSGSDYPFVGLVLCQNLGHN